MGTHVVKAKRRGLAVTQRLWREAASRPPVTDKHYKRPPKPFIPGKWTPTNQPSRQISQAPEGSNEHNCDAGDSRVSHAHQWMWRLNSEAIENPFNVPVSPVEPLEPIYHACAHLMQPRRFIFAVDGALHRPWKAGQAKSCFVFFLFNMLIIGLVELHQ